MGAKPWLMDVNEYVNPDRSDAEHDARFISLLGFVVDNKLSIQEMVSEMGTYLASTDNAVRTRGMLLLAEIIRRYPQPLEATVIHSLAQFFAARIADWHALCGAVSGCLSLLSRQSSLGILSDADTIEITKSFLKNTDVQSLPQRDRFLCLQLMEKILTCHAKAVVPLGSQLVHGFCAAVEGETDPQCLKLTLNIMKLLVKNFSDPEGPIADYAKLMFDIISCYFPVSFNSQPDDACGITQESLSTDLQDVFASTSFFAPSCIQLFVEKLSSDHVTAKLESLKYLGHCALAYGADVISEHAMIIWKHLKSELFPSYDASSYPRESSSGQKVLLNEAVTCLVRCIKAFQITNNRSSEVLEGKLLNIMLNDEVINDFVEYLGKGSDYCDRNLTIDPVLAIRVLADTAHVSCFSVAAILKKIMSLILWRKNAHVEDYKTTIEVIVPILGAAQHVAEEHISITPGMIAFKKCSEKCNDEWLHDLRLISNDLLSILRSTLEFGKNTESEAFSSFTEVFKHGVCGLQALMTFPSCVSPLSNEQFEVISHAIFEIIVSKVKANHAWESALGAAIALANAEEKFGGFRKPEKIVQDLLIPKLLARFMEAEEHIHFSSYLRALAAVSRSSIITYDTMLENLATGLLQLSKAFVSDPSNLVNYEHRMVAILQCISEELLPRDMSGRHLEGTKKVAINIWASVVLIRNSRVAPADHLLASLSATAHDAVQRCDFVTQEAIWRVLFDTLWTSRNTIFEGGIDPSARERSDDTNDIWMLSVFAAMTVALMSDVIPHPVRTEVIDVFIVAALSGANQEVICTNAQAVASILNKWSTHMLALEATIDLIVNRAQDMLMEDSKDCTKSGAICLLGWVGKGLVMRGHTRIIDILKIFISILKDVSCQHATKYAIIEALGLIMGDGSTLNKDDHAIVRPLYKQRFFNSMLILLKEALRDTTTPSRVWLYRGFAQLLIDVPHSAMLSDAGMAIPLLLEGISLLSRNNADVKFLPACLMAMSSFILDVNQGRKLLQDHVTDVIQHLICLSRYPKHVMIRETALQCLSALIGLPFACLFPSRLQVLKALKLAIDDSKRSVRAEAIRCHRAWYAIATK